MESQPLKRLFWENIHVNELSTDLADADVEDFGL